MPIISHETDNGGMPGVFASRAHNLQNPSRVTIGVETVETRITRMSGPTDQRSGGLIRVSDVRDERNA